ncbi:YlxQ-related RNA-binding protein [Enterococcus sp. CSURQ0835]|uniref:YlxQ-related RNA-binding protein n=1 Tax=Enterococcus sp. CSURQ0835 TaxID=2681394 RepID=UPI00135987F0|nr:YlxQ-related RNA-binding protein [Enterococcus sp. CSURQ0835]
MNKQKALNLLGLAMRAGKLITGEELTVNEIRRGRVYLTLVASDASENTKKKLADKSTFYQTPYHAGFTQSELSGAIGKPRKVIGVTDAGFAKKLRTLITG